MAIKSLLVCTILVLATIALAEEENPSDDEFHSNFLHSDDHVHNKE